MQKLIDKIERRAARCGVIGLGYVGLPLALEFARVGFRVVGIDLDEGKVQAIQDGRSYIVDVSDEEIARPVREGKFSATTDFSVISELDTINICVPTPLRKTKDPDLTYVVSAVNEIRKYLRPGQLVILESTTYPGTTEEVVRPTLEASGLEVGLDFCLAFSPERIDPGNPSFGTRNIPKVVGGVTARCTEVAKRLYEASVDTVVPVSSTQVAEMVKLLENTFRSVNIGLVNEIALMCSALKIDVWEVIEAAKTKPFGFMAFYPGPGLGGHCIPIDPFYLTWKAREFERSTRFIELAGEINTSMPVHVVERLGEALNSARKPLNGSRVLVLGLAYKPNVDDERQSPSYRIMELLKQRRAEVAYHDPYVPVIRPTREHPQWAGKKSVPWDRTTIASFDAVVIATAHACVNYQELADWAGCIV